MTKDKITEIANQVMLQNSLDGNRVIHEAEFLTLREIELAKAFLALSEKHERYEKVVEAARSAYGFLDDSIPSSLEKLAKRKLHNAIKALDELELGDSEGRKLATDDRGR